MVRLARIALVLAGCSLACSTASVPAAPSGADAGVLDAGAVRDAVAEVSDDAATVPPLRVLFIGNSYTYVNDLPRVLRGISESSQRPPVIATDSVTAGGATMQAHWEGAGARPAIARAGWTHVVLQGQSQEPLFQPAIFQQYAALLAGDARDAGALPAFFETWARRAGEPDYQQPWSGGTPAAMQDGLLLAYGKAATDASGVLVKVGEAWRDVIEHAPSIVLFQADGSHPTVQGTWLAACVFYVRLTGNDVPPSSRAPAEVSPAEDAILRDAATRAGR
jgi:hypothetical protein